KEFMHVLQWVKDRIVCGWKGCKRLLKVFLPEPHSGALPGCATPRFVEQRYLAVEEQSVKERESI
ncbi:hypothetical protein MUP29_05320, partial [bacterium]|nr:hypothetical protein [bacterium]